jgi:hypothetical protein
MGARGVTINVKGKMKEPEALVRAEFHYSDGRR